MTELRRALLLLLLPLWLGCATTVTLEGRVNLFGPAPTAYVGMVTTSGEHLRLSGPLTEELRTRYQGQRLRLRALPMTPAQGPGRPAVYEVQAIEGPVTK